MSLCLWVRDWAKKTLVGSGLLRFAADLRDGDAAILMYHSVLPDPNLQAELLGGLSHSEAVFRAQMELLAKDYHPISLDEALKCLRGGEQFPKRSVLVTFDDGYTDNYEVAMPILHRFAIPATFYVVVDCLENRKLPWPARLRFAFRKSDLLTWTDASGKCWSLADPSKREEAFKASCEVCCQLRGKAQEQYVQRIAQELQSCPPSQSTSFMMTHHDTSKYGIRERGRSSAGTCRIETATYVTTRCVHQTLLLPLPGAHGALE